MLLNSGVERMLCSHKSWVEANRRAKKQGGMYGSSEKYLRGCFLQPFPEISASEIGQEKRHKAVARGGAGVVLH